MSAIAAVFYRDYRQRITNIGWLFWDLLVPVAYLVLFGVGFDRAMPGEFDVAGTRVDYVAFLLPGVLAMTCFGVAMNTSWGFFMDKDSGIFYELLTYPITREQLLIGKICFNVLLAITGAILVILVAVFALHVRIEIALLPVTFITIAVTTAGWFFLFSIFAVRLHRMDSFNTLTSAAYIILMFISTLFYPIDQLPAWFRGVAMFNPMTWQVDILRYSMLGLGSTSGLLLEAFAFVGFALLCLFLSARSISQAG
jgi:ABC-2 type transport system permease protein